MNQDEFGETKPQKPKAKLPKIKAKLPKINPKIPQSLKSKKNWIKITIFVIALLGLAYFVCAITAGIGIYKYRWDNQFTKIVEVVVPYPASIAGGEIITMKELRTETGYITYFYDKTAPEQMPEESLIEKQVLDRLIRTKVVKKLARENGISQDSAEVEEQFQKIAEENGGEEKVAQILSDLYGLDIPTFKRLIADQLLEEKLKDKFENDLQLQVKTRHILVKVGKNAKEEEKEAARKKAEGYLKQIKEGANFAEVAKKHSEDEASQGQGGELPFFSKGQTVKEYEEAAFSMEKDEISDPILSQYGYHIIEVLEKKGSINNTFDGWIEETSEQMWITRFVGRDVAPEEEAEEAEGEETTEEEAKKEE